MLASPGSHQDSTFSASRQIKTWGDMDNNFTTIGLTSHTTHQYTDEMQIKYRMNQGTVKLSYDKFHRWQPTSSTLRQGTDGIHFEGEYYDEEAGQMVTYNMTLNASELLTLIPAILDAQRWYS